MTDDNPYAKHFSPLEMLALAELPEKARVQRLASILIRKEFAFIYNPTQVEAKKIVKAVGEPRGRKGWLSKALPEAVVAQRRVRTVRQQRNAYEEHPHAAMNNHLIPNYQPVCLPNDRDARPDRIRNIRMAAFYRLAGERIDAALIEAGYPGYYMHHKRAVRAWPWTVPEYYDGGMITVYTSYEGYVGDSKWKRQTLHPPHKLLIWTDGDTIKIIRSSRKYHKIADAINSLKTSVVKKAEERGDIVQFDIRNEQFLVRNPKRKKWREIPVKRHSRG